MRPEEISDLIWLLPLTKAPPTWDWVAMGSQMALSCRRLGQLRSNQFWGGVQGMGQFFLQLGAGRDFAIKPEVGEPPDVSKNSLKEARSAGLSRADLPPTQLQELQLAPIFCQ